METMELITNNNRIPDLPTIKKENEEESTKMDALPAFSKTERVVNSSKDKDNSGVIDESSFESLLERAKKYEQVILVQKKVIEAYEDTV